LRSKLAVLIAIAIGASACEIGQVTLPVRPATLVIHGILSPTATTQTVLVERTLTGGFALQSYDFSSSEAILSDGGEPESSATVTMDLPDGRTILARELQSFSSLGNGAGMYIFSLPGTSLVLGGKYKLKVVTTKQEVVTAETIVPVAAAVTSGPTVTFNRETSAYQVQWADIAQSRGYQVRIDGPYVPWITFTDSNHISLTGDLRSLSADRLPHVFIPGFRQSVSIAAVDANVYDYYRTYNNSFTGSGLINRVKGGVGVFGAMTVVARQTVNVIAPTQEPIEGKFEVLLGSLGYRYGGFGNALSIAVYVESASAKAGQPDALSGAYGDLPTRTNGGFVGTRTGSKVKIAFLTNQLLRDTVDVFTGELRGDTLDGTFKKGAPAKYVRQK
jgi:hypothetical protein